MTEDGYASHERRIRVLEGVVCNLVAASSSAIGTKAAGELIKQIHAARSPDEANSDNA